MYKILICDDDSIFHMSLKQTLKNKYECRSAYNGDEALVILGKQSFELVLLDIQMRSPDEGLKLIPRFLNIDPDLAIVMSSAMTDFQVVREAMRLGAADYIVKNVNSDELLHAFNRILERKSLLQREEQHNFESLTAHKQHILIGESPLAKNLRKIIEKVKNSSENILISGETGTGKELVARQLRKASSTGVLAPFVSIDSSTIQSSTAESTLFGHEKGAFTGAERTTKGIFEEANNGTVYFDEISNMPLEIQAKLLRVLQEKEITRMGSSKVIQLDFQVICATNHNIEDLSKEGKFKYDLFQRLNVIPIHIPPLRDRTEDIPLLLKLFTQRHSAKGPKLTFSQGAIDALKAYSWPGNIRELSNLVAFLSTMVEDPQVDIADLPPKFQSVPKPAGPSTSKSFYKKVNDFEEYLLNQEYRKCKGNITQLALVLEMDRSHLYTKLKEFGIHGNNQGGSS